MPLLSDVVVIFMSSVVVLTPNGHFLDFVTVVFSERFGVNSTYAGYGLAGGWRKSRNAS
jgi:hypothetical protein